MPDYIYPPNCRTITPVFNSYEFQARAMVINGMIYFDNHPADIPILLQFKTPFEITTHLPVLFKSLIDACRDTPAPETLAHVLGHLKFAVNNGWDAYIQNLRSFGKSDYSIKKEDNA